MRVKIVSLGNITQQTAFLIELPDLPTLVVQVWSVFFDITSSSAATAITHTLWHDVNLGTTLSTLDVPGQWMHVSQGRAVDSLTNHIHVPFWPEPYELIGPQRWVCGVSNGTVAPKCTIHYTMRKESNKTLWNLLRARTSFERD